MTMGFNFGFDLLVTYTNRFIVFKNTLSQPCGGAVSLQPWRHLAYRLRLASFDNSGKLVCSRSTGYQLLTLEKDQVSPGPQYPVWSMSRALPVGYCVATQRCQKPWSALERFCKLRSPELSFWALKLVYYDQV
uniref:Uncharacterized protein n=1 Tax=Hucho hucho TaxID=62062 RepID=A0A4W5PAA2_9TELE